MARKQKIKRGKRDYTIRTEKPRTMKKGEVLEGRIISIVEGHLSPILTICDDNGEVHRLWMSTVLEQAITPGDVGSFAQITYKGEVKSQGGRPVHDYEVGIAPAEDSGSA